MKAWSLTVPERKEETDQALAGTHGHERLSRERFLWCPRLEKQPCSRSLHSPMLHLGDQILYHARVPRWEALSLCDGKSDSIVCNLLDVPPQDAFAFSCFL